MTQNKTKWEALSLKDKASLMKIFISQGIQDPTEMKDYYNKFQSKPSAQQNHSFADGGEEDEIGAAVAAASAPRVGMTKSLAKRSFEKKPMVKASTGQILSEMFDESVVQPIKTVGNVAHAVLNPKETLYRIMSQSPAPTRSISEVMREIKRDPQESLNSEPDYTGTWVDDNDPNNKGRNLNKLYLYQDETGVRELNETEKNEGVNYSAYLKSIGRNPKDIKQYEGDIGDALHFPEYAKENIETLADLNTSKAIGMRFNSGTDNVAGHLAKLGRNAKGEVTVTRSDLWDFEPKSYSDSWGADDLSAYAQAAILDKYGTPFILKDTDKVSFEKPEVAFDEDSDYGNRVAQYKFLLQSGIFPEMTITPTGNTFAPAAMLALGEVDAGQQRVATSKTNTNKKAFGGNLFGNGGQTNMDEVYAMQRQMNPELQQRMSQPSPNQGTLAAAPKGTFSKGYDNRTSAQRNADYLHPIKGAAERNAQAYQNGNSVWNGIQTVGETALNAAAATVGAGALKGATTAISKVAPMAGQALKGAGYLVDTNPLNYLTPNNNVQSTARKATGVFTAPNLKGMASKAVQAGSKVASNYLYNQSHFAMGGPLFNEDNPIEAFGGTQILPTVRFSKGGKIKKRRKSRG